MFDILGGAVQAATWALLTKFGSTANCMAKTARVQVQGRQVQDRRGQEERGQERKEANP